MIWLTIGIAVLILIVVSCMGTNASINAVSPLNEYIKSETERRSKVAYEAFIKRYQEYEQKAKEKAENPHRYWTVKQINIKTGRIECHVSYPTIEEAQGKGAEWLKPYPGIPQDHYIAIFSDDRIHQTEGNKLVEMEEFGDETLKAIRGMQ